MRKVLLCVAIALATVAPAVADEHDELPDLDELDPAVHAYDDAIVEHAQVVSRNLKDRIWVDIIRPDTDEAVPTILIASPYFNTLGRGWRGQLKTPHQGPSVPTSPGFPALGGSEAVPFPEWYDEYFVPRGYAVALMDLRGTRNTSGCQEYGDRKEVYDAVDVIDWIADQPWSNGKVGMTGGSYDGTIAIGAAAEAPMSGRHPDALAAIIPIRAIDRWYDYAFVNGAQITSQSLVTPSLFTVALATGDTQNAGSDDLLLGVHVVERKACIPTFGAAVSAGHASPYQDARSDFWRQRDFARTAGLYQAATFIIHGLFDFNVKPHNAGYLWDALPPDLPKRLWWYYGAHGDPHAPTTQASGGSVWEPFADKFVEATHRWYAQFLKGLPAGALDEPAVEVQQPGGGWLADDAYPVAGHDLELSLGEPGTVAFRDGPRGSAPTSVTFTSPVFTEDTRISGELGFDLLAAADGPDATFAVTVRARDAGDLPTVLTYGWLRAFYRDTVALRGRSTPTAGSPLNPGEPFAARFGSLHTDVVMPAGSHLEFTVSAAAGGTLASNLGGDVTIFTGPDASRVLVPIAD